MPGIASRIGHALRNRRAGEHALTWHKEGFQAPETIVLTSTAFAHGAHMPQAQAGKGVGGNISPELSWSGVPSAAVEKLVLIVEDPDVPLARPITHARVAEISPETNGIAEGGIHGYRGARPIPGHGPHRYVFQLFAYDASGRVVARGRLDGVYER